MMFSPANRRKRWFVALLLLATICWTPAMSKPPVAAPGTAPEKSAGLGPTAAPRPLFSDLDAILSQIERDAIREINGQQYRSMYEEVEKLARRYETEAHSGSREAQYKLGAMYLEGVGVRANSGKAWQWLSKAGGADHPLALVARGRFHLQCRNDAARDGRELEQMIEALGQIGPAASDAVPALVKYLHGNWSINRAAATALARLGERGQAVLLTALTGPDVELRRIAVTGFSELVEVPESLREPLTAALQDEDSVVREYARRAMYRLKAREQSK